jgi:hypothetical protein
MSASPEGEGEGERQRQRLRCCPSWRRRRGGGWGGAASRSAGGRLVVVLRAGGSGARGGGASGARGGVLRLLWLLRLPLAFGRAHDTITLSENGAVATRHAAGTNFHCAASEVVMRSGRHFAQFTMGRVSIFCLDGGFAAPQHVQGGPTPPPKRPRNPGYPPTFVPSP